jgi:hypothetical protein
MPLIGWCNSYQTLPDAQWQGILTASATYHWWHGMPISEPSGHCEMLQEGSSSHHWTAYRVPPLESRVVLARSVLKEARGPCIYPGLEEIKIGATT